MWKLKVLVESELQDTYNIQVVEQRSHSFAFGFPPEGDFAPKAHYKAVPKQSYHARDKKVAETQRSGFQKQLKLHEKAVNKRRIAGHVRHQKEN